MPGISVRQASLDDLEAVAEISRLTWEGEDYLEGAAKEWVCDGSLYVGESDGAVLGTFRLSLMPRRVIWLEALRVHAAHRGRGFGRKLAQAAFERGRAMISRGEGSCMEFSTYVNNHESIHISRSQGFRVVDRYMLMTREGPEAHDEIHPLIPAIGRLDDIMDHIPCGWKYPRFCGEGLEWALERSEAFSCRGVIFMRRRDSDEATPAGGSARDPVSFIEGAETLAAGRGEDHCCILFHESRRDIRELARGRGYSTWEPVKDHNVLIFRYEEH